MEKNYKVMIIDDEEGFILPLELHLKKKGIDVISFTDPEEGIEYIKNNTVHVLLTDYHMEPAICGDEVIRRVREFNKDIIIYLQTAYAEKLPAEEMLDNYQIQGYINKGDELQRNIQLIKASLKQADLIELVKQQKKEIDARQYQNEFFGKFLGRLMGEIGERAFSVVGVTTVLEEYTAKLPEEDRESYNTRLTYIKEGMSKLEELIKRIKFDDGIIPLTELIKTLQTLFWVTLSIKNIELNIANKIDNDYQLIQCNSKVVLYILVDMIEFLIEKEKTPINILIEKEDNKVKIKICNEIENKEIIEKINKLSELDEEIHIIYELNQVSIILDK